MDALELITDDDFAHIVRFAPLVSIDLIIGDHERNVLLGLRVNELAPRHLFAPRRAVRKNESLREAFARILNGKTGLTATFDQAKLLGAFEHFYTTNRFGDPDYGTHYVVLAYELPLDTRPMITTDQQHSEFQWMSVEEIRSALDVTRTPKPISDSPK